MESLPSEEMTDYMGLSDSNESSSLPPDICNLRSDIQLGRPISNREDIEIGQINELLRALPTKADIEAMIFRVSEIHEWDLQEVRSDVQQFVVRVIGGESAVETIVKKMAAIEQELIKHMEHSLALQLHIGLEDQSRWGNLRLRGLSETIDQEELKDTWFPYSDESWSLTCRIRWR